MSSEIPLYTSPTPTRADAVKNRLLLIETARRLFTEQGVEEVPMSAIAEAAGVGKGTLYRHFENKIALCEALLDEDQRDLQQRTFQKLTPPYDAEDVLKWFVAEVVRYTDRNRRFLYLPPGADALHHPAHWWWRQTLRGLLSMTGVKGDLDFMTDYLYLLFDVKSLFYLREVRGYSVERIISGLDHSIDLLLSTSHV